MEVEMSKGEASLELYRGQNHVQIRYNEEQVQLIKDTVAKGASDNELRLFLHLAQTYGLDPFAKEIWCIKYGNNPATIFTSRDGYLKIANTTPAFDGIVSDVVHEKDHFKLSGDGVEHQYQFPRGAIVGAYALVFRKDRAHPVYVFAPFEEYNAGSNQTWKKYPSAMILKVAEAMALKRAFSISGLVTREELDASQDDEPARQTPRIEGPRPMTAEQEDEIRAFTEHPLLTGEETGDVDAWLVGKRTEKAATLMLDRLNEMVAQREAEETPADPPTKKLTKKKETTAKAYSGEDDFASEDGLPF